MSDDAPIDTTDGGGVIAVLARLARDVLDRAPLVQAVLADSRTRAQDAIAAARGTPTRFNEFVDLLARSGLVLGEEAQRLSRSIIQACSASANNDASRWSRLSSKASSSRPGKRCICSAGGGADSSWARIC